MKTFKFTLALLCISCIMSSCKKDDDPTKTDLLTSKDWKTTALTIDPAVDMNGDGTADTDMLSLYEDCQKDDLVRFGTDKTVTNDEGETKCDPDDPQTSSGGTWSFNSDETELTIVGMEWFGEDNQTVTFIISELTSHI
jgi:hypothetical protein